MHKEGKVWKAPAALSKSAAGLALPNSDVAGKINNCIVLFFLMMKTWASFKRKAYCKLKI